jgi:hypothetical protein
MRLASAAAPSFKAATDAPRYAATAEERGKAFRDFFRSYGKPFPPQPIELLPRTPTGKPRIGAEASRSPARALAVELAGSAASAAAPIRAPSPAPTPPSAESTLEDATPLSSPARSPFQTPRRDATPAAADRTPSPALPLLLLPPAVAQPQSPAARLVPFQTDAAQLPPRAPPLLPIHVDVCQLPPPPSSLPRLVAFSADLLRPAALSAPAAQSHHPRLLPFQTNPAATPATPRLVQFQHNPAEVPFVDQASRVTWLRRSVAYHSQALEFLLALHRLRRESDALTVQLAALRALAAEQGQPTASQILGKLSALGSRTNAWRSSPTAAELGARLRQAGLFAAPQLVRFAQDVHRVPDASQLVSSPRLLAFANAVTRVPASG